MNARETVRRRVTVRPCEGDASTLWDGVSPSAFFTTTRATMKRVCITVALAVLCAACGTTSVTKIEVRERIDTLIVKGDTIRVVDRRSDTLVVEKETDCAGFKSVRAALDTTVAGVRIYVQYAYPPDRWAADIIQRDTVIRWTVRDSVIERPYEIERVPMWVYFVLVCMGLALIAVLKGR